MRQSLFLKEIKAVDSLAEWIFELKQLLDSITPLYIIQPLILHIHCSSPQKSHYLDLTKKIGKMLQLDNSLRG